MTTQLTITDILKAGNIYMDDIYSDTKSLEIEIGEFVLTGELELEINETPNSNEAGKWTDEEITSQIYTLKSIYDNEACEELDVSKSDVDVVEAWFKTINIDLCKI